ncbi:MAG: UDP-sulfoquinovose synthase, partial [uncultured Solirubrobacteraceae bacterium]
AHSDPRRRRLPRLADRDAILGPRPRCRHRGQLLAPPVASRALHRLPDPDPQPRGSHRRVARGLRQGDPGHRRQHRGRRVPRPRGRPDPSRSRRPLRRAAFGALLDDLAPPRGRDPADQRHRQPQPALVDPRARAGLPPGQARDDGRVRHAQHRHRRGLHRDRAQGPQGHAALPEAARLALPRLEGPRLDQHPLRLPDVGIARDRPQPGPGLRHRDRRDEARRPPRHALRLRRDLRHRAQPLLRAGGHRASAHRLRQGRPDPRRAEHPRHAPVRRAGRREPGRPGRVPRLQPVHRAVLGHGVRRDHQAGGRRAGLLGRDRALREPACGARGALLQRGQHQAARPRSAAAPARRRARAFDALDDRASQGPGHLPRHRPEDAVASGRGRGEPDAARSGGRRHRAGL